MGKVEIETPQRRRAPMLDKLIEIAGTGTWANLLYDAPEGQTTLCMRPDRIYGDRGFWYVAGPSADGSRRLRADRVLAVHPDDPPAQFEEELEYSHPSHPLAQVLLSPRGVRNVERDPHLGPALSSMKKDLLEFHCPPAELDWYARYFGSMGTDAVVQGGEELLAKVKHWVKELAGLYT